MTCSITTHYVCYGCGTETILPTRWNLVRDTTGSYYLCERCDRKRLIGELKMTKERKRVRE